VTAIGFTGPEPCAMTPLQVTHNGAATAAASRIRMFVLPSVLWYSIAERVSARASR
jgi:hypothetical protein